MLPEIVDGYPLRNDGDHAEVRAAHQSFEQVGVTGSDRQTWEVRAQEPGTAWLTAEGSDGTLRIEVTVE